MYTRFDIQSLSHPELAPYRNMRLQTDHLGQGVFIAEGEKIVRRLLESPLGVISVLLPPDWEPVYRPLLEARAENIRLFVAPKTVLSELTGFHLFQGVLALGIIPPSMSLGQVMGLHPPQLVAALDGITNAVNVGLVIRNAAALGIQALIIGETCAHPYLRRSVRSAMGTIFRLPYFLSPDLKTTLADLRSGGIQCIAAHPHTTDTPLPRVDLTLPTCIVLGSEGHGLRPEVLSACSEAAVVPMQQGVDSLNVGNASAVFFYEAWRQRQAKPAR